jgi:DNA-directed RNA polymerase beta' subunit
MRPSYNVLSPSNGEVILKPTQDMVIGCYYLTLMIAKNKYILQKWFSNEKDALSAFYQKKITIHTSILVRYHMKNFSFEMANEKLIFNDTIHFLNTNENQIVVKKTFQAKKNNQKYYFITNIGIFIGELISFERKTYILRDFFLETTPGRLIFSINVKNSINQ